MSSCPKRLARLILLMLFSGVLVFFEACSSYKNITYFNNVSDSSRVFHKGVDLAAAAPVPLIINADDILKIDISTLDPGQDGALNLSSPGSVDNASMISSNITSTQKNLAPSNGYRVNKDGDIEVPVLGRIHVAGQTTDQVREAIYKKASVIYKNPVINVRLINFKVTVLGEVAKPGTYLIEGEQASVLDALGLAGDLTIFGKRENIMLIRQQEGEQKKVARLNMNNTDLMASPFFYLKQGDVLYVEPSKGKAASTDAARTRAYSVIGAVISVLIVLISRIHF